MKTLKDIAFIAGKLSAQEYSADMARIARICNECDTFEELQAKNDRTVNLFVAAIQADTFFEQALVVSLCLSILQPFLASEMLLFKTVLLKQWIENPHNANHIRTIIKIGESGFGAGCCALNGAEETAHAEDCMALYYLYTAIYALLKKLSHLSHEECVNMFAENIVNFAREIYILEEMLKEIESLPSR